MAIAPNLILLSGVVSHNEDIGNIVVWIVYMKFLSCFGNQSLASYILGGNLERRVINQEKAKGTTSKVKLSISSFQIWV